jgi:hypothetical protein
MYFPFSLIMPWPSQKKNLNNKNRTAIDVFYFCVGGIVGITSAAK